MAHKMVCLEDFITGERFQGLAEVSVIPLGSGIGESECDFVVTQQRNNNYKTFLYSLEINEIPDYVQNAKSIFVNNWTLDKFFTLIFPKLKNKYIFISHNSDQCFSEKYTHYLDSDKVISWYSQNATGNHKKLFGLPIGIANQQYQHGNLKLIQDVINSNKQKNILVYKNFDVNTNQLERGQVDSITNQNGIFMLPKKSQLDYFSELSQSLFCINPPGNGPDCHRVWEGFYFNTIPIMVYNSCFKYFKHLPIIFVKSWSEVTIPFLREKITSLLDKKYNINELKMSYWKEKIFTNDNYTI